MTQMFAGTEGISLYSWSKVCNPCPSYSRWGHLPPTPCPPTPSTQALQPHPKLHPGQGSPSGVSLLPGTWASMLSMEIACTFPNDQIVQIKTKQETNAQFQKERERWFLQERSDEGQGGRKQGEKQIRWTYVRT